MSDLNKNQKFAVGYTKGPLLIIAGAGTGKTTVITEKIAYLINNGLAKPEEILAVTFTEKATTEMEQRVADLLPIGGMDVFITTFHGLAQRMLENNALDIGIPNNFKLLNETDTWLIVRKHLEKFELDYYRPLANPTKFIHAMIKHFQKCKDELIGPKEYLDYAQNLQLNTDQKPDTEDVALETKRINELANAYHAYNLLLLENNALDFADLMYYAVKLLRERPNILKFYQKKFKYILVDEFQDTNWSQYELIKLLTKTGGPCLTVVGDDDQSIYKFRGASVSNILQFKDDYPDASETVLNENYRSGQKILDLAYNFIQLNNPDRLEDRLKISKKLIAQNKIADNFDLLYGDTADSEATLVVNKIIELKKDNPTTSWNNFAILCRANHFADQFMPLLSHHGIPYHFGAMEGLFRQKVILDSLAFLKLCDNYHESAAVYRLLSTPVFSFSHNDFSNLSLFAKREAMSLFEALKNSSHGRVKLSSDGAAIAEKVVAIVNEGARLALDAPVGKVLYHFWEKSGYLKLLSDSPEIYQRDIFSLQSLFEKIENFQKSNSDQSVRAWLEYFNYLLESGDDGEDKTISDQEDAIKIMSVHAAKGLEFDYVFVPNLVDQRFPSNNRSDMIELPDALVREGSLPVGDAHLQEERRLLYVAITRAKKGIYFSAAKDYGGTREKKISKFILEIESANKSPLSRETTTTVNKELFVDATKAENIPQTKYAVPDEFSFSQLESYDRCPWQYRFQFILHIPTFGKGVFSFGKTMHSTLQKFYERLKMLNSVTQDSLFGANSLDSSKIKVPTLDELISFYETSWQDQWFYSATQKDTYRKKGLDILREFYQQGEKEGWTVPITLEAGFYFKLKGNTVKGQIDRIDKMPDGKIAIIDYKTGKPKDKLKADDKSQLLIYQIAAESVMELKDLGEVGELRYYFLENNSVQSFKGTDKEIEKEKIRIDELITEIKNQNFTPAPNKEKCQFCDFRDICDFRL